MRLGIGLILENGKMMKFARNLRKKRGVLFITISYKQSGNPIA